ncbi:hypothetical protein ACOSP6_05880 [Tenacibaculum sp. MEBiC06402]|uniref:hypothetical protein n=1 Tax=unclassified Tenacibaculum TaxID=2635139 RepID=UPI003B9B4C72
MNQKYYFFFLVFVIFISSCSNEETIKPKPEFSISSYNSFIGDTLTIKGTNLNELGKISIYNESIDPIFSTEPEVISKSDTEIKFIVPFLYDEIATIYFNSDTEPINFNLFGYIPYKFENNGSIYRYSEVSQILNDNIAFCYDDNTNRRFKLINNYNNIVNLPSDNSDNYNRIYYADENSGYILSSTDYSLADDIYSFNGDINNKSFLFSIKHEDINSSGISKIKFISESLVYVMTSSGEMFQVLNEVVTPLQNLYPELNNTSYLNPVYQSQTIDTFEVLDDNSIIIAPQNQNYIIRINDDGVSETTFGGKTNYYNNFDNTFITPKFYKNNGAFYSSAEQKIYKSTDYGKTWTAYNLGIPTNDNIFVEYLGGDQFILHQYLTNTNNIDLKSRYISTDNGNNWRKIFHTSRWGDIQSIQMYDKYGLTTTSTFGMVKFKKFPNNF